MAEATPASKDSSGVFGRDVGIGSFISECCCSLPFRERDEVNSWGAAATTAVSDAIVG